MSDRPPTRSRRFLMMALCAAILLPPLTTGLAVARHGVNVPYWDEWDLVPVIDRALSGRLGLAEIVSWHNDHRFIVPRLGVVLQAMLWRWDTRVGMWVSVVLAGAAVAAVFATARRWRDRRALQPLGLAAVASAFLFSPAQWDNWTMSIQFAFFLPVLGAAGAAALAGARPAARLAGTLALCLVATAANMTGLVTWLVAVPLVSGLAQRGARNSGLQALRPAAVWLGVTVVVAAVYMAGAPRASDALWRVASPGGIATAFDFTVCLLGAPLAWGTAFEPITIARVMGWLLLGAFIVAVIGVWRGRRTGDLAVSSLPWVMLGLFALIAAGLVAVGRAPAGIEQALESRYATLVVLFPVALAGLLLSLTGERTGALDFDADSSTNAAPVSHPGCVRSVMPYAIGAVMAIHVLSATAGLERMEKIGRERRAARAALHYSQVVADTRPMVRLFPDVNQVRERARRLDELGQLDRRLASTAVVRDAAPSHRGEASGQIESLVTDADRRVVLGGWAALDRRRRPADLVGVAWRPKDGGDDQLFAWAEPDPDSADKEYLWRLRPYLRHASWTASIALDAVPAAAAFLTVWAIDASSGRTYRIGSPRPLPER